MTAAPSPPRVPGTVAEVLGAPEGGEITAFFDLDGTLVAGFTAAIHARAGLRSRELGLLDLFRILAAQHSAADPRLRPLFIAREVALALPGTTTFTHLEPLDHPLSYADQQLGDERFRS